MNNQGIWHSKTSNEVMELFKSNVSGLSQQEVLHRLEKYGKNKLPEPERTTLLKIVLHQVLNPLIFILIAAAVASMAIGDFKDAIFIGLVILINSALGTYQEYNAEKSAESMRQLIDIKSKVKRENKIIEISAAEIVPGDIVLLESGMKVPADIRLLTANDLMVDESLLTGESVAIQKNTETLQGQISIGDKTNMAFAGSIVLNGRGLGIAVATGVNTQVGIISEKVAGSQSAKPPLVLRMEKFIRQISVFIILLSVVLAIFLRYNGYDWEAIFFFVVALAVSAIPEGLPVALTVALSVATKRMAKRNVIVRKLTAVESLGSCTIIASDKTGTLTVNQQTAKVIKTPNEQIYKVSGEGYNGNGTVTKDGNIISINDNQNLYQLALIATFANEGQLSENNKVWEYLGDSMDVALLGMIYKLGIDPTEWEIEEKPTSIIPYESEKKFSGCYYQKDGKKFIAVKGALETILEFCAKENHNGKVKDINVDLITQQANDLARNGYRVLAFANGVLEEDDTQDEAKSFANLTFQGIVGFIDPLRPEAITSVEECHRAGIKVLMITGDHPETARSIAKELSISDEDTPVITGEMLRKSGDFQGEKYKELVCSSTVFARVSPTQKLEIVDVLIRNGEFVAVTGDGVNDAPALKRANIGVAMGGGTDVAKEVGSMIVVDDNFSSIVAGVEEGRFAYDNVRKVIFLLISTGAAEIVLFLLSIAMGLPLPLLAVQLLWLNLVTNGIQDVALAFEGGEPDAMKRKPRKTTEKIFNDVMIKKTIVSAITMGGIVFGLWYYLNHYTDMTELHARNIILLLMVFMQNFHAFNSRSERESVFRVPLSRNWILVIGVFLAQGIHIMSMYLPFMQTVLRVEPITLNEWFYTLLLAVPILVSLELYKLVERKIGG